MTTETPRSFSIDPAAASADATSPDRPALWQFVPIADYVRPEMPASSAAANAWASFKHLLSHEDDEALIAAKKESDLRDLSEIQRTHLAPPPNWGDGAAALDSMLAKWLNAGKPDSPIKFVIGQPHCGHASILRIWADQQQAAQIIPPDSAAILAGGDAWLDAWPAADRLWVLPRLEHCYLRHAQGLSLVRQLLERAESGRLGRGIIGCDSWAWAYLQHIWPVPKPAALTLQAFDAERLGQLFSSLDSLCATRQIHFRNATNGKGILHAPPVDGAIGSELTLLAAHCRGNLGTAQHYWREKLRAEPDADLFASEIPENAEPANAPLEENVWVTIALPEPVLSAALDEETILLLHALLLHGGLPESLLPELMPFPASRCMASLLRLRNAGLIRDDEGRWIVSELSYATVRSLLRTRDYLTDDF